MAQDSMVGEEIVHAAAQATEVSRESSVISSEMPTEMSSSSKKEETPLAERQVLVHIQTAEKTVPVLFDLKSHPEWTKLEDTIIGVRLRMNVDAIKTSIESGEVEGVTMMQTADVLSSAVDHRNITRATTTGIAKAGFVFDVDAVAKDIAEALTDDLKEITISAAHSNPFVTVHNGNGTAKVYTLLSTGYSDFSNSTPGRLSNVHKAIDERVNNVMIPMGAEFNLVDVLDNPITEQKGWKIDIGLMGGGATPVVGAGICQSAVTTYRSALLAGLPIKQKRNHSLFVDHYEYFGIGLDATVFPGVHNLRFVNDTQGDILIQAYTQGETVILNIYGIDDNRTVKMDGPYFMGSKNRHKALQPLSKHQIGWVRTITYVDGTEKVEPIVSTYAKPLWNAIIRKYDGVNGMELITKKQPSEESIW